MLIVEYRFTTPILQHALDCAPEMHCRYEQQHKATDIRMLFWARGGDHDAFAAGVAEDPTVTDLSTLAAMDDRRLYGVRFTEAADRLSAYYAKVENDGTFLSAEGDRTGWSARMRFPDRASLAAFREACVDSGFTFDLQAVYRQDEAESADRGVTDPQRDALLAALDDGYFEIPRGASLADLADRLGVSGQAASERLRRGMATLVEETFAGGNYSSPDS